MDIIPILIDGAVVLSLDNSGSSQLGGRLVVCIHNWVKQNNLEYLVFDFQDEKKISIEFLTELMQLRKRLKVPFLFSGVMEQPGKIIEAYNCNDMYPFFWTPEDAIRALRIQNPGITESSILERIKLGHGLLAICGVEQNISNKSNEGYDMSPDKSQESNNNFL